MTDMTAPGSDAMTDLITRLETIAAEQKHDRPSTAALAAEAAEVIADQAHKLLIAGWRKDGDGSVWAPPENAEIERLRATVAERQAYIDSVTATAIQRADAAERELWAWRKMVKGDRIGFNDDGSLDDIVLTGMAHLEQMDGGSWYLGLYRPDGSGYQVWLGAKKGNMLVDHEEIRSRALLAKLDTPPPSISRQADHDQGRLP